MFFNPKSELARSRIRSTILIIFAVLNMIVSIITLFVLYSYRDVCYYSRYLKDFLSATILYMVLLFLVKIPAIHSYLLHSIKKLRSEIAKKMNAEFFQFGALQSSEPVSSADIEVKLCFQVFLFLSNQ